MKLVPLFLLSFLGLGCAGARGPLVKSVPFQAPETIAILPLDNQTTDLRGPDFIRAWLFYQMQAYGYAVEPLDSVDKGLAMMGISDAGQLPSASFQALQAKLKVPAAVFGELVEFKRVNWGIYAKTHIELKLKLVELSTGRVFWECEDKISEGMVIPPSMAADYFTEGLSRRWLDLLNNTPMENEVVLLTRRMARTLPLPAYAEP